MVSSLQLSLSLLVMGTKNNATMQPVGLMEIVELRSAWRWVVPLFALLALLVLLSSGGNIPVFYALNHLASYAPDTLWTHLSMFADGQFLLLFVLPFLGKRAAVVWQYVLALMLGGLYVPGMKELFSQLRPPAVLEEGSFHLIGPALQNNAFPSGHTTAAFALAGLVCLYRIGVHYKIAALLFAILIGWSRIANGVHWPLDVLGGALGGWLIANLAVWLSGKWRFGMHIRAQRIFALIMVPVAIWGIWALKQNLDDVYPGTDAVKALALLLSLGLSFKGLKQLSGLQK